MRIVAAVAFHKLHSFLDIIPEPFFKCIQKLVVVGEVVHELEVMMGSLGWKGLGELAQLRFLLQILDQSPHICAVDVVKDSVKVGGS